MNNERYKYPPIDVLDIKEIEVWLEEMAGRGLFLKEAGPYAWLFAEEEPKTVRYRIEPAAGKKENWMPIGRRTMKLWDGIMWQNIIHIIIFLWRIIRRRRNFIRIG